MRLELLDSNKLWQEEGYEDFSFHNRLVLDQPPRVVLQLGGRHFNVNFGFDAKIVDLRSHFNLDLVVFENKEGEQAIVTIEWPTSMMPHGWPRGDAPSPDSDPIRRFFSTPKEPHSKFTIFPGSLAGGDTAMREVPCQIPGGMIHAGFAHDMRMSDTEGKTTVNVTLMPGATDVMQYGFPNTGDHTRQRVIIGTAVTPEGRELNSIGSVRLVFDDVSEMDPRNKPCDQLRVPNKPAILKAGQRFRDAQYDPNGQTWRIHVDEGNEGEESLRRVLRYYPDAWQELDATLPPAPATPS